MQSHFRRELFIGFAVVFGSILVFGVLLFVLSRDLSGQAEQVFTSRKAILERATSLDALANLKQGAPQAERYKRVMNQILAEEGRLNFDFPVWLEGLARGRGLSFSFNWAGGDAAPTEDFPGSTNFSFDAGGPLSEILGLVEDMEARAPRYLIGVEGFELRREGSGYRLRASGKVFFRR